MLLAMASPSKPDTISVEPTLPSAEPVTKAIPSETLASAVAPSTNPKNRGGVWLAAAAAIAIAMLALMGMRLRREDAPAPASKPEPVLVVPVPSALPIPVSAAAPASAEPEAEPARPAVVRPVAPPRPAKKPTTPGAIPNER